MSSTIYRLVQLNLTPEIQVFHMLFDRSLSQFNMTSLKQHMEYFNFRSYIQLDFPVHGEHVGVQLEGSPLLAAGKPDLEP